MEFRFLAVLARENECLCDGMRGKRRQEKKIPLQSIRIFQYHRVVKIVRTPDRLSSKNRGEKMVASGEFKKRFLFCFFLYFQHAVFLAIFVVTSSSASSASNLLLQPFQHFFNDYHSTNTLFARDVCVCVLASMYCVQFFFVIPLK